MINRRWLLAARPSGALDTQIFERSEAPIPEPGPRPLLVRVTHLSFDPTQRGWMTVDTYIPAIPLGNVVRAKAVGQVMKSNHPQFRAGQLVHGAFGWQDYALTDGTTAAGSAGRRRGVRE